MWLRMINFKLWVHWRIPFLGEGGFIKNHYIGENCLKRVAGGVGQFPDLMEGLSEKEGSSWGEGGLIIQCTLCISDDLLKDKLERINLALFSWTLTLASAFIWDISSQSILKPLQQSLQCALCLSDFGQQLTKKETFFPFYTASLKIV